MSKTEKMERLDWDMLFFAHALILSTRGTCDRLRTATVIVDKDRRIIGGGYNGAVAGTPNCDEAGHLMIDGHCERTLHGEENAILSIVNKDKAVGATAYIVGTPCIRCTKSLLQLGTRQSDGTHKGLARICYLGVYPNSRGSEFLEDMAKQKGVELAKFDLDVRDLFQKATKILESKGGILNIQESLKRATMDAEKSGENNDQK